MHGIGIITLMVSWYTVSLSPPLLRTQLGPDSIVIDTMFTLPATMSRWALYLPPLRYHPQLTVNGTPIPLPGDDFLPRVVDLTPYLHPGPNTFRLVVSSWTSRLVNPPEWLRFEKVWYQPRRKLEDQALAPIGGHYDRFGIWGAIRLVERPGPFLLHVNVWPFPPDSLVMETALSESSQVQLYVRDSDRVLWHAVAQGSVVHKVWYRPPLQRWWPDTPRLYTLEIQTPGETARVAVGWRRFETQQGTFVLNGQPLVLCGASFWPPFPTPSPDTIRLILKRIRQAHALIFRTHTRPWDTLYYAMADTLGLMMIPEAALFNDDLLYRLDDPRLDHAVKNHHATMIRVLGHHPSVVMWSLGNELWGKRSRHPRYERLFGSWLDHARSLDPTRPFFFEGDGDPAGKSDVIGIHYPLPWPRILPWPMVTFFLDRPIPVGRWFWPRKTFRWHRTKPLYIGEFLWWPSRTPHPYTMVVGDRAFLPDGPYLAKAQAWQWQIVAYRHFRVSGFAPWNIHGDGVSIFDDSPLYRALQDGCKPTRTAFRRFRRGAPNGIYRDTLEVFHDAFSLDTFRIRVEGRGVKVLDTSLVLGPFQHRDLLLQAVLPAYPTFYRETLRAVMERHGYPIDVRTLHVDRLGHFSTPRSSSVHQVSPQKPPWGVFQKASLSLVFPRAPHSLVTAFPSDFFSLWGEDGISAEGFLHPPPSVWLLPLLGAGSPQGMRPVAVLEYDPDRGYQLWHTLRVHTPEGKTWLARVSSMLDTLTPPRGVKVWPHQGDLREVIQIPEGQGVVWLRPASGRLQKMKELQQWARKGGRVWVENPSSDEANFLGLTRKPLAGENVQRLTDHPLARWLHLEYLRSVGPYTLAGGIPLTDPATVVMVPEGEGFWVVSSLKRPRTDPVVQRAYLDILRMLVWAP